MAFPILPVLATPSGGQSYITTCILTAVRWGAIFQFQIPWQIAGVRRGCPITGCDI